MELGQAKHLAWEGLVVVTSILVAFALDAWWDTRGASADLRRELLSVQSELVDNRSAIADRVRDHRFAISSIEEVIRRVQLEAANATMADSLLYRAFVHSPTSDPSTGGLDALISSGRLALLGDVSLKSFLAGFRNRVEDVREDELGSRHVGHNVILPLIRTEPGIAEVLSHSVRIPRADGSLPTQPIVLLRTPVQWPAIHASLNLRKFWLSGAVYEGEALLKQMDRAAIALSEEVGDS